MHSLFFNLGKFFALLISNMTIPRISFDPAEKLNPASGFDSYDLRILAFCPDDLLAPVPYPNETLVGVPDPLAGVDTGRVDVDGELRRPCRWEIVGSRDDDRLPAGRRRNFVVNDCVNREGAICGGGSGAGKGTVGAVAISVFIVPAITGVSTSVELESVFIVRVSGGGGESMVVGKYCSQSLHPRAPSLIPLRLADVRAKSIIFKLWPSI